MVSFVESINASTWQNIVYVHRNDILGQIDPIHIKLGTIKKPVGGLSLWDMAENEYGEPTLWVAIALVSDINFENSEWESRSHFEVPPKLIAVEIRDRIEDFLRKWKKGIPDAKRNPST